MNSKRSTTTDHTTLISVVIAVKDEEEKLPDCLESVSWVDEIILVDTGSKDKTVEIAKDAGVKVFYYRQGSYSDWKNFGFKQTKGDWILFIDADERVTPLLKKEIIGLINSKQNSVVFAISRKNIILGRAMMHGGWWPDNVIRLFKRGNFIGWKGKLHEQPEYRGALSYCKNYMIHLKHDNLEDMVDKTNEWSVVEAKLLFDSGHPLMSWWRFFRIMATELWLRLIILRGILDGPEGVIYAFYQMWSKFLTYAKLWEMQLENQRSKVKKLVLK